MDLQAIFIYCLCSDVLQSLNHKDNEQAQMTSAEIMTFVILSALFYQCNYKKTRVVVQSLRFFPKILSYSRINRRIYQIPCHAWMIAFQVLQEILGWKNYSEFIVDSFPIPCCQNNKIFRCRLFQGKEYHGYTASKKSYFWGIKVHMIVTPQGIPVEFTFTCGSESDVRGFRRLECDLPKGSRIYADRAYTDYLQEELLKESGDIDLIPRRKKNSKRQHPPERDFLLSMTRNLIETTFSAIVSLMPRCIRAVTQKGFYLKVFLFIFAYTINKIVPQE
jgi:IS5 family transposase